jgi:hypothetical protein
MNPYAIAFLVCLIIWLLSVGFGVLAVLHGVLAGLSDDRRRAILLTHAVAFAGGACATILGFWIRS